LDKSTANGFDDEFARLLSDNSQGIEGLFLDLAFVLEQNGIIHDRYKREYTKQAFSTAQRRYPSDMQALTAVISAFEEKYHGLRIAVNTRGSFAGKEWDRMNWVMEEPGAWYSNRTDRKECCCQQSLSYQVRQTYEQILDDVMLRMPDSVWDLVSFWGRAFPAYINVPTTGLVWRTDEERLRNAIRYEQGRDCSFNTSIVKLFPGKEGLQRYVPAIELMRDETTTMEDGLPQPTRISLYSGKFESLGRSLTAKEMDLSLKVFAWYGLKDGYDRSIDIKSAAKQR
jgi:hypothetical protein